MAWFHPWVRRRAAPLALAAASAMAAPDQARAAQPDAMLLAATGAGRVELGAGPSRVPLSGAAPLPARVQSLPAGRQIYLVIKDLRAAAQPGVVYDVYLGLPPGGPPPGPDDPRYVGALNFFAAAPPDGGRTVSYDVTQAMRQLQAQGQLLAATEVTIVPESAPAAEARPSIGQVELVAQ